MINENRSYDGRSDEGKQPDNRDNDYRLRNEVATYLTKKLMEALGSESSSREKIE